MKMENEAKNQLIAKYRTELFETDGINLKEINDMISDEDLKAIIQINNSEMGRLLNKKPFNKELFKRLFVANLNFYKLAKTRNITVQGKSFLLTMGSAIDYNVDKIYSELTVGSYTRVVNQEKSGRRR